MGYATYGLRPPLIAPRWSEPPPEEIQNDLHTLGSALGLQGQPTTNLHATSASVSEVVAGEYDLFSPSTGQRALGRSLTVWSDPTATVGRVVLPLPEEFAAAKDALDQLVIAVRIDAPT